MTINILEIGASSLLDFDFNENRNLTKVPRINITKSKNTKDPKFSDKVVSLNTLNSSDLTLRQELHNKDVIVFSVGDKGKREEFQDCDPINVLHLIKTNFTLNASFLSRILSIIKPKNKKVKLIYLGSISAGEDATYPNHAIYAAMKSAMKSLWATVKEENKNNVYLEFIYLELPQIKSRMSSEGEDPSEFRKTLIKIIDK